MTDVRDIGERLGKLVIAMAIGCTGAFFTGWSTSSMSSGDNTAQGGWFVFCSTAFAFLLCGAAGGIVIELLARRHRAPCIPRARIVSRTGVLGSRGRAR
jgi:hypothetical protein